MTESSLEIKKYNKCILNRTVQSNSQGLSAKNNFWKCTTYDERREKQQ